MRIGGFDTGSEVLIVAEIGNNHEGDFGAAQELVDAAREAGADAVKFQTYKTEHFQSPQDEARFQRLRSYELSYAQFETLAGRARSLGLRFLSTPLDLESAAHLEPLVDAYKIASGDNDFYPLIERVCRTGKPLIVSSGLSDLAHIRRAHGFVVEQWRRLGITQELAVLHCVTSYPTPPSDVHLAAIGLLREQLGCTIGYSDHSLGVEACVLAVAAGARILEKHFTLDKSRSSFRDHQLSADPRDMRELVRRVREASLLVGRAEKVLQPSEASAVASVRRSIAAAADLPAGHVLTMQDLTWLRPAAGLPPGEERKLLGRALKEAVAFGQPLRPSDVE